METTTDKPVEQVESTPRAATAETITVEAEQGRQLEHYGAICELTKVVCELQSVYEVQKAKAAAAKKEFEIANAELVQVISRGPDWQLKLFDDEKQIKEGEEWRSCEISDVLHLPVGTLKSLKAAGIETVGDIADWTNDGRELADIAGVGQAKAEQIETSLELFWGSFQDVDEVSESDSEGLG